MPKRSDYISWDEYFMGIALLSAMRSTSPARLLPAASLFFKRILLMQEIAVSVEEKKPDITIKHNRTTSKMILLLSIEDHHSNIHF